jgi:hypothetical protein
LAQTQLEAELLDRRRALLHQDAPDLGAAGERQVAHDVAAAQHGADVDRTFGIRRQHAEHARRHAGALRQLGQRERRQRRLLGRLDDHRAAGGQRRRDLARDHRDRKVPRRDRRAHADRLADDERALARVGARDRLAVGAARFFGKPLDEGGAVDDFAARLGERLALLGGHDARQVVGMLQHQVEPAQQHRVALLRALRAPRGRSALRSRDRGRGVDGAEVGRLRQLAPGRRVADREARRAADPFAVDQAVGLQQRGVGQGGERRRVHAAHSKLRAARRA